MKLSVSFLSFLSFVVLFVFSFAWAAPPSGKPGSPTSRGTIPKYQGENPNAVVGAVLKPKVVVGAALKPPSFSEQMFAGDALLSDVQAPKQISFKHRKMLPTEADFDAQVRFERLNLAFQRLAVLRKPGMARDRLGKIGMNEGIDLDPNPSSVQWKGARAPFRWHYSAKSPDGAKIHLLSSNGRKCVLNATDFEALPAYGFARSRFRGLISIERGSIFFHPVFVYFPAHRVLLREADLFPKFHLSAHVRKAGVTTWNISNVPPTRLKFECVRSGNVFRVRLRGDVQPLKFRFYNTLPGPPVRELSARFSTLEGQKRWLSRSPRSFFALYKIAVLAALFDRGTKINGNAADVGGLGPFAKKHRDLAIAEFCKDRGPGVLRTHTLDGAGVQSRKNLICP